MRKQTLRFTSFRLAVSALGLLMLGHAPAVFAQCTTSAWTSTTGTVVPDGSAGVKTELEYEGNCGLTVNAASSPGYVTSSAPNSDTVLLTRFYIYADDLTLSNAQAEAEIYRARGNGNTQIRLLVRRLGDGLGLAMEYRDGNGLVEHPDIAPLLPTWQAVTVGWTAGAGSSGSAYVKIDGREMMSAANVNNGSEFVSNLDLGLINDVPGGGKVVIDAFEARRASPEPPLLTVNELFNIATRAKVGTGRDVANAGFIIQGATQKCVIIRGRGPSISLNQPLLANPFLTLANSSGETIDSNNNWQGHPNAAVVAASGRAPTDPLDAAIYTCLEPGAYTAQLSGAGSSALGIGIVEVIDQDQGTPFLFNIATRANVEAGANRAVAGFIIEGDQPKTVLIRGRGPSINLPANLLLANPTLDLRDSNGASVITNNDWQQASNASAIEATGRAPENALDAAILRTLQPGAYTVFLASNTSQTGIGIIEVLDITGGSIEPN